MSPVHEFPGVFLGKTVVFRVTSVTGHVFCVDFPAEFQRFVAISVGIVGGFDGLSVPFLFLFLFLFLPSFFLLVGKIQTPKLSFLPQLFPKNQTQKAMFFPFSSLPSKSFI